MNVCHKCNENFKSRQIIDGKVKTLKNRKYCLKCSPFGRHNTKKLHKKPRESDEVFSRIVSDCVSLAQVMSTLNLKAAGANYRSIRARIIRLNLDTSHFKGQAWSKGRTFSPKRPIEDYLNGHQPIGSNCLKKRLLKEKLFEHKCYKCNNTTWNDQPIPIQLEHIDGNHTNNSLSNLTILCPNCHAQTSTYCGKNKGNYKK